MITSTNAVIKVGGGSTPPETPTDSILFYSPNEFSMGVYNKTKNWNGTLYYSTDHNTWTEWTGTADIQSALNGNWHTIYLKGLENSYITGNSQERRFVLYGSFIKCVGNLINLLNKSGTPNYSMCFNYLFSKNGNIDFDVELPASIIENGGSYFYMFSECTSLTKAPALPATTLAGSCYSHMFNGCVSLKNPPALLATTLTTQCYSHMFNDCTSLTSAPELSATTIPANAYQFMFAGCASLKKCPKLPAINISASSYQDMFNGCKSLEQLPELPTAALVTSCYRNMFSGCTKIKLSTEQTGDYQTEYRIPSSGTGTDATSALTNMFNSTGGTFTGTPTINTTYYTSNTVIPAT